MVMALAEWLRVALRWGKNVKQRHIIAMGMGAAALAVALGAHAAPLDDLTIEPEVDAPYDRVAMYGDWQDADGDCQNTRHEVLADESLVQVTLSDDGCKVTAGLWFDPYTGLTFTDPGDVDIDHLVPLKEAHQSGAHAWNDDMRRSYANDLDNPGHLIAVDDGTNQSKGHKDPAQWLPPNAEFHCTYVAAWLAVKRAWQLTPDDAEAEAIRDMLEDCGE